MELDLDQTLDALLPWDFSIRINGASHATRPLVVADVALLGDAVTSKSLGKLREAVTSIFVEPRPDLTRVRSETLGAALSAVLAYWKASAEKNSASISAAVDAEVKRLWTIGRSPSP